VPWQLSRSCQTDQAQACGTCGRCVQRRAAFEQAGVVDPLTGTTEATHA
jgi:7-cyano-7-deazaguanine synthase